MVRKNREWLEVRLLNWERLEGSLLNWERLEVHLLNRERLTRRKVLDCPGPQLVLPSAPG